MAKKTVLGEDGKRYTVKEKKPFYKKWWTWLIIIIVIIGVGSQMGDKSNNTSTKSTTKTETKSNKKTKSSTALSKDYKVGDTVSYQGYEIKINSVDYSAGGDYDSLDSGEQFVIVNVTITNNTDKKQSYNPYDFKLNADGNSTDLDSIMVDASNQLNSGYLDKGATVTGNLYGEASTTATSLKLQYQTSFWNDKTVDITLK